jgi:lipopolysaccharide export system protein LptC
VTLTNPRFVVQGRGMTLLLKTEHVTLSGPVKARVQ